jgi:hypothetical protein
MPLCLTVTNTQGYCANAEVTMIKSFILKAHSDTHFEKKTHFTLSCIFCLFLPFPSVK